MSPQPVDVNLNKFWEHSMSIVFKESGDMKDGGTADSGLNNCGRCMEPSKLKS